MNYKEATKYLYSKIKIDLGLETVKNLLKKLDNPEDKIKTIHVAGTNGKGSTSAYLASMLIGKGFKVGVYTSPHLVDLEERIKINNKLISKRRLTSLVKKVKPHVKKNTFFEIMSAITFQYFYEENVDYAIIETGMGGRFDATNVITPKISIITNITKDHTEYLGNTLKKIAYEKAGIIKKGIPVVTAAKGEALKEIRRIAKLRNSKVYTTKKTNLKTPIKGEYQKENLSIAIKALEVLNIKFSKKSINNTLWPGRMQFVKNNLLFDAAHNPAGMKELRNELKKLKFKNIYFILGIKETKDAKDMIKYIDNIPNLFITTQSKIVPSHNAEHLSDLIKNKNKIIIENPKQAINYILKKQTKDDLVVVAGSIFLLADMYKALKIRPFKQ